MTKFLTLTLAAITTLNIANAQTGIINMQKRLAAKNKTAVNEPIFPVTQNPATTLKESAISTTLTFNPFSGCSNVYGLLSNAAKPLQYNNELNTVSFIQRKSATYTGIPADNSGVIVAMISNNWGANWDSTCIYSSATDAGRYPQGGIYNPIGNTNIASAYVVGCGPAINGGNWSGSWYASKQLAAPGSTLYNNTASSVPNAMQLFSNSSSTYAPNQGKQDFSQFGFTSTNDGAVRSLAQIANDINASQTNLRGAQLVKGQFSAGVFIWTTDSFIPPVIVQPTSLEKAMSGNLYQAWNETGTTGYLVFIGSRTGQTYSNIGWQPIVYKTTNSGTTWALLNGLDFNNASYRCLLNHLDVVWSDPCLRIPFFNPNEGIDCVVDALGKLHIATTIASTASQNSDSLANITSHGAEDYTWQHTPGKRPYLYDFITDGTGGWTYNIIDSLESEAPGSGLNDPGFNDNPWDDQSGKITSDSRIQLSRTPDGQYIIFTWAESDSNVTNNNKKWNTLPNLKARLLNTITNQLSITKINVTKPISGNGTFNPNVANKAMLHYTSTKSSSAIVNAGTTDITVPITICNSNPYSQLTNNVLYFSAAKLTFTNSYVPSLSPCNVGACSAAGYKEITSATQNIILSPNPAKGKCELTVNLTESGHTEIKLLNYLGENVLKQNTHLPVGSNKIVIDLSAFSKGVYFVTLKQGNNLCTKKLIVE